MSSAYEYKNSFVTLNIFCTAEPIYFHNMLYYSYLFHSNVRLPYWMKIFTEFNLAIWLRMVKFMELNISEFWFLIIEIFWK